MFLSKFLLRLAILIGSYIFCFLNSVLNPNQLNAQDCFKGGVYELNINYKYSKDIYNQEYKKIFYIHEEKSQPGSITLFELVPLPINTPNFDKGGLKPNERIHFIVGGYCQHKWDGKHIFLPQTKHLKQELSISGLNQHIIYPNRHINTGDACPVSLYFYGSNHRYGSKSPSIQDTIAGLMSLEEHKVININNVTIISDIHKLDWSEKYIKSLHNLSQILNHRFNHIIEKRKLIRNVYDLKPQIYTDRQHYLIEKEASALGNQLWTEWKKNDEFITEDRTEYYNLMFNFPKPEWPNEFPTIKETCVGYNSILYNMNDFVDNRELFWDLFNQGRLSEDIYHNKSLKLKSEYAKLKSDVDPLEYKINRLNILAEKIKKLNINVDVLNNLCYSDGKPRLFQSPHKDSNHKIIYDDLLYNYRHINEPNNKISQFKIKYTNSSLSQENIPQKSSKYSLSYNTSLDYKYSDSILKTNLILINNANTILNEIDSIKLLFKDLQILQELNSSKEILKILITDSLQIPRYLKKSTFLHYRFDTNLVDKESLKIIIDDLSRVIDFIRESHYSKDFDLDKSDSFLDKQIPKTNPKVLASLHKDPQKGANILSSVFALLSHNITSNVSQLAEYLDDGDIPELLSKLYDLDEDDIEDELEIIIKSKDLSYFKLDQVAFESYKLRETLGIEDQSSENISSKNAISNLLVNLDSFIDSVIIDMKSDIESKSQIVNQIIKFTNSVDTFLNKKVFYTSNVAVQYSNIPEVDYSEICSFLSNYNLSRGLQADLFKAGNLRNIFVNKLIQSFGNSIITSRDQNEEISRHQSILTFEPLTDTWNVITYKQHLNDQSCIGFGHLLVSGFIFDNNSITLKSVSIGNFQNR
jgi:hypothetical protein